MSEDAIICLVALAVFFGLVTFGFFIGRDHERAKQARENARAAARLRTAISMSDYDSRISEFVPLPTPTPQSACTSAAVEARSTAIMPPSFAPRPRCHRGPERCLCEECTANGVPPSP